MGNDIDVLSQDEDIDAMFWRSHGPKNESTLQFFRRSFDSFCNSISSPKRSPYSSSDLTRIPFGYVINEFDVDSQGTKLHCCRWMNEALPPDSPTKCVVYLHTNTRNLSDAIEVFPFCIELGAHLLAFDLPGAGRSEGKLSINMTKYLDSIMDWIGLTIGKDIEVILWARGMSTAIAVEYCAIEQRRPVLPQGSVRLNPRVSFAVLDTPFESIKLMIDACLAKLNDSGHEIPSSLVSVFAIFARRVITKQLQGDPYAVTPMEYAKQLELPCMVIANMNDDYVPLSQQVGIAETWSGQCALRVIEANHFGPRPKDVVSHAVEVYWSSNANGKGMTTQTTSASSSAKSHEKAEAT